jgi:hypothetical protein
MNKRESDDRRDYYLDRDDGGSLNIIENVNFLGHYVSSDEINLTDKAVKRIKRKISEVIYIHLLLYPRQGHPINPARLGDPHIDWDLVTCLNEVRRYIYGGLKERDLTRFLEEDRKLPVVRGLMAFYPLVSSIVRLAELDGWLTNVMFRALRERNRLILNQGLTPYIISKEALLDGSWHGSDVPNETSLPSFVLGWRAARKFYKRYGLSEIRAPSYYSLLNVYG